MSALDLRPRVLHLTAIEYSAHTLLLPQLHHLSASGFDVRLACAPDGALFHDDLAPFRPQPVRLPRSPSIGRLAVGLLDVVRVVRSASPDILHLHSPAAAMAVRAIPRSAWPSKTKIVYTVHGFAHQWEPDTCRRDRWLERVERRLSHRTDALLFQSKEDFEQCLAHGYGGRLALLGNGVEDGWHLMPPVSRRSGKLRSLFIGRLVAEKGLLELLAALKRTRNIDLTIVGKELGSERDGVQAIVNQALEWPDLRDRLKLRGYLDKPALARELAAHDCLVLPSYREGVPRSVIEAMASARPVVTTDIRGCRELVTDGVNGFLVPPRDVEGLAGAIERLRDLDSSAFRRMGAAGRRSVEHLRESAVFARIESAYAMLGVRP